MSNSRFYQLAIERINAERKRLDDFCEALDKNPMERKSKITEYKCARYRYAGLTNVWWALFHSHRTAERNVENHYLDPSINDVFITVPEYVVLYDNASEGEIYRNLRSLFCLTLRWQNTRSYDKESKNA